MDAEMNADSFEQSLLYKFLKLGARILAFHTE